MALRFSRRLCEYQAGYVKASRTATTLALVDNGASKDKITDTGALLTSGGNDSEFEVGDWVEVYGATSASNDVIQPITSICASTIWIPTGSFVANQSAGSSLTLRARGRADFASLFRDAQLDVYSGSIPANPETTESGTLLISYTGLKFAGEVWDSTNAWAYVTLAASVTATASATGTAGWYRLRGGGVTTTGADSDNELIRIDGTVGVSSGDLQVPSVSITSGNTYGVSQFRVYFKQAA
jgi:hypothetical protein